MATELVVPLALAAATVGALHSLAPDHDHHHHAHVHEPSRTGAGLLRGRWTERQGDGAAGLSIATTGVAVALLGW